MNACTKKTERNRDRAIAYQAVQTCISVAILAADDLFGLNEETTRKFVNAYAEVLNGYAEEGIEALNNELAERGIIVDLSKVWRS